MSCRSKPKSDPFRYLSSYGADDLVAVAATLNARPRKTLDWKTSAEMLDLAMRPTHAAVATTG